MKRKIFSTLAVVLFMSSSLDVNAYVPNYTCSDLALDYLEWYEDKYGCVSAEQASDIYTVQEALCLLRNVIIKA